MKALLALAMVVSTLGFARDAAAAVWKGKLVQTVFWNNDPHIYQENWMYDTRLEIVLGNGRDSNQVYHLLFHSGHADRQQFAQSLFNTAKESLADGKPLWLLVEEGNVIVGMAVGPNHPSDYPLAVRMIGKRDIRKGSGGPAWVQVAGAGGPRDILGRSLRP